MSVRGNTGVLVRRLKRFTLKVHAKRDFIRLQAVALVLGGATSRQAANALGCTRQAVNKWIRIYRSSGDPHMLLTKPRSGRPLTAKELTEELLGHLFTLDPSRLGYRIGSWTVETLADYLKQQYGINVGTDTLRRRLHQWGFRYKRPRYVYEEKEVNLAQKKGDQP
jgi:transposase